MASQHRPLPLRVLGVFLKSIGGLLLLVATLLVLVLLLLNLPPTQRFALDKLNGVLADSFQGTLRVERLGSLSLMGVRGANIRLLGADGKQLLDVRGANVTVNLPKLGWSAVLGSGPLVIDLARIEVAHADVRIAQDAAGTLTLQKAFEPKHPKPEEPPATRPTHVLLRDVRVGHAWIHGSLAALPTLDAELYDLALGLWLEEATRIDLQGVKLVTRALPRNVDPAGTLSAKLTLPSSPAAPPASAPAQSEVASVAASIPEGRVRFEGVIAQIPVALEASKERGRLAAKVNVAEAKPEPLRRLVPALKLSAPARALIVAEGTLPRVELDARLSTGQSSLRASGHALLEPQLEATVQLDVNRVDASAIVADAPETDVGLRGTFWVKHASSGALSGKYTIDTEPARIAEYRVPALSLRGTFTEETLSAELDAKDSGVRADLALALRSAESAPGARLAEFNADVSVPDLARIAPILEAEGKVQLHAKGSYHLDRERLAASGQVSAQRVQVGTTTIASATVTADVEGAVAALQIRSSAKVRDARFGGERVARADITAVGPVTAPRIGLDVDGPRGLRVRGSANVAQGSVTVRDIDLRLERNRTTLRAQALSVRVDGDHIDFSDVNLSGAGQLRATGHYSPASLRVRASARDLDLARISRFAGLEETLRGGTVALEADLHGSVDAPRGTLVADVRSLSAASLNRTSARAELELAGRTVNGSVHVDFDKAGQLDLQATELTLPRGRQRKPFTGELRVEADLELAQVAQAIPEDSRPFDRATGRLALRGYLRQGEREPFPELQLIAKTTALELVGKGSPEPIDDRKQAKAQQPWRVKGVDGELELALAAGDGAARVNAKLYDEHGGLLLLDGKTDLPAAILHANADTRAALLQVLPLDVQLYVPKRDLAKLPPVVRPAGVVGSVELRFVARGTARDPMLQVQAQGRGLRAKDPTFPSALDVNAEARYQNDFTQANVDVYRGRLLALAARTELRINLHKLIESGGKDPSLRAAATLDLKQFPLQSVPVLKERQVDGDISGRVALTGLGEDASLKARATLDDLALGGVRLAGAIIELEAGAGELTGSAELKHKDGYLRAKVSSGLVWGKSLVPSLAQGSATRAELTAEKFRIGVFQPFVAEQVSTLDGVLDARLLSVSQDGRTTVRGQAQLSKGVVQIPAIGQEFSDVQAKVTASEGGIIKIDDIQARGRQGRLHASAGARLDGLDLRTARIHVLIRESEKLPLTTQGVEIGDAWGKLETTLFRTPDGKNTTINVQVQEFHLELPENKQNDAQSLDDAPNIRIGVRAAPDKFHALPLQPLEEPSEPDGSRMVLNVALGRNIWVRQGTQVRVRLGGSLRAEVGAETVVTGTVNLAGGQIDVQGKRFEIEQGTVTFQPEDPANPVVVATARYDSPDGYRVYADFTGPVKTGKLSLRSEPPLSNDQILSLLMFGSPDGSLGSGSGDSSTAATAVGVGGGAATQGLNAALGDLTDLDITTRIDTSRGSPTPELVMQLSPRLSAQLGYNLGDPGLGKAPDKTFITLNLRLRRRWSLMTTLGDRGLTSVDAVWRHRY